MKNMRTKSIALVAGLAFTGIGGASAASLGIATQGVGAGVENVASCDTNVDVSYSTTYVAGETGGSGFFKLDTVTVSDLAAACDNLDYEVMLIDSAGAQIGPTYTGYTGIAGWVIVAVAGLVDAEAVGGVAIVVSGNSVLTT